MLFVRSAPDLRAASVVVKLSWSKQSFLRSSLAYYVFLLLYLSICCVQLTLSYLERQLGTGAVAAVPAGGVRTTQLRLLL
jgi:hypothetical protein